MDVAAQDPTGPKVLHHDPSPDQLAQSAAASGPKVPHRWSERRWCAVGAQDTMASRHVLEPAMGELQVRDVMSTKVVAVTPSAHFREVAELMLDHGIGAVPVIDDAGGLLAIISDADLIAKQAYAGRHLREGRATCRSRGRLARELMTAPVETALADDLVHSVAQRIGGAGAAAPGGRRRVPPHGGHRLAP
jgi:CBS domain-containing protein